MTRSTSPLVDPGAILRSLSEAEAAALVTAWLHAFGQQRQGLNLKAYLWHVFSGGAHASWAGKQALAEYEAMEAPEYLVLSNDRKTAFSTDQRPVKADLSDYLVFPPNLAWTMCFTHEDGWLGPYFAKHRDFDRLDVANRAQIRKQREAHAARAKGWR